MSDEAYLDIMLQGDFQQNKDSNWLQVAQSPVSSGLQSNIQQNKDSNSALSQIPAARLLRLQSDFHQNKDSNEPPGKRNPV